MKEKVRAANKRSVMEESRMRFDDPIEVLMKEHNKVLEKLSVVADSVESIQLHGFSGRAFQDLTNAASFISAEMRKHSDKEEIFLFPLLEKHVFESPNVLRHERREIWQAFNELMTSIKDVEDGRIHGTTIRELIQSSQEVVEKIRNHIIKENTILFPMVKRVLQSDEYEQLRKDIISVN
jgi:iron-sulfur cluster repair protein YtfE (RIC family)